MDPESWEGLEGAVVDGRFRLCTLTYAGRNQAEFKAEEVTGTRDGTLFVTLIAAPPEEAGKLRRELAGAANLDHPHLLRILGAGQCRTGERELLYLASEPPDELLADRLAAGPLPGDEARALLADVAAALEYLHGRGLAYRSLGPQTIVRVGNRWKLADFGQVHPIGVPDPAGVSASDGSRYLPPEAYDGVVLAASDVWSFGALVSEVVAGTTDPVMLPEPFDRIRTGCFQPDPEKRLSLQQIRVLCGAGPRPAAVSQIAIPQGKPAAAPAEAKPPAAAVPQVNAPAPPVRRAPFPVLRVLRAAAILVTVVVLGMLFWPRAQAPAPQPKPAVAAKRAIAKPAIPKPAPMPPPREVRPRPAITGRADYFGDDMNGRRTASGSRFDNRALTAAHPTLPMGTRVKVTNLANDRSVVVTINDRAAARRGYVIRVSRRAAERLGFASKGSARVSLETAE